MSRQTTALARSMARHHENDLFISRRIWEIGAKAGQHRDDKTESGWECRLRCRDDLMECAAGKPAVRQVGIKCGKTERKLGIQGLRPSWMPRQQKAQFGQSGGAAFDRKRRRKCWRNKHLRLLLIEECGRYSGYVPELDIRTKREQSKRQKVRNSRMRGPSPPWPTFISRCSAGFAFRTAAAVDCPA